MSETELPPSPPEDQPLLWPALGGLVVVLAVARWVGAGPLASLLALSLLVGVPVIGVQLTGAAQRVFFLIAALGGWLAFGASYDDGLRAAPILLVDRLAYFAVPPLVLGLVLTERDRARLKLGWLHLYAPAVVMSVGAVVHLVVRWGAPAAEAEIQRAATYYAICYLALTVVALLMRLTGKAEKPPAPAGERAIDLEDQGRFALAARVYEREGQVDRAAQAAERAGDWARAARLHRQAGQDFTAAEMFYRARMWPEALESYAEAGAFAAAARLCMQLGQTERAVALYERAGDLPTAIRTLEEAGQRPSTEQYRKAGMFARAAQVLEAAGHWTRAADIYENDLRDLERAAVLHLKAASFVRAGRLLETLGRKQEALEAYAATPAGAIDAARLHMAAGQTREATQILARMAPAQLDKLEDEASLTLVARAMLETDRLDDAARILQRLKRQGSASGPVHLLLGRIFLAKKLPELAEEELRVAASLPLPAADETQAAYLLGCVLEGSQKYEEAAQVFHGILQKDLQYADVQERYRRVKKALGKRPEAVGREQ